MPKTNTERISVLEYHARDLDKRIQLQEEKNDSLAEIAAFVRLQTERNKKHDQQFAELTKALQGINANLLGLNRDVKSVKSDVGNVINRVETLESDKITELTNFKKSYTQVYLKIVSGVILAVVLLWLGLK